MSVTQTGFRPGFYVAGGTLLPDALSYVERQADQHLYQGLMEGHFCYVLTARQMGKSSLMIRTVARLRKAGIGVAVLDLTAVGQNLTAEQWYGGLLLQLAQQLDLEDELFKFWEAHLSLGVLQRWMLTIREVILPLVSRRIVIFVDEIDMVRSLPFSVDEFFAGIRQCYNARSEYKDMEQLSFSLLGVAAPTDLVRDPRMTPFNIGRRIELRDFTESEAMALAYGLGRERKLGAALLQRILHWTGGHPYLTQRLCLAVAEDKSAIGHPDIDRLCTELFLSPRAHERDDNLLFVREQMLRGQSDVASLLDLYLQIRTGQRVSDDEFDPLVTTLRLSGITHTEEGQLKVRNRIYARVFDREWTEASMPAAELRRQRAAYRRGMWRTLLIGTLLLALGGGSALLAVIQHKRSDQAETNRRLLYDTQIRLAQEDLDKANIGRVDELLGKTIPNPAESDLRSFEWYHFWREAHRDILRLDEKCPVVTVDLPANGESLTIGELPAGQPNTLLLKAYDLTLNREMRSLRIPFDSGFKLIAFSPDHQRAVVPDPYVAGNGRQATATLWNLSWQSKVTVFKGHNNQLSAMALSADGQHLATADMDGAVKLWNTNTGKEEVILPTQRRPVKSLSFSRNGSQLAAANESHRVILWNTRTGKELTSFTSTDLALTDAAFLSDGTRLLTAAKNGSLQIWDIPSRKRLLTLTGHSASLQSMAFSPDGTMLATGSSDRTVRVWSVATGHELRTLKGHGSVVNSVAWSPDGKHLVTGGDDGIVKVWDVTAKKEPIPPGEMVTQYLATAFFSSKRPWASNELLALGVNENNQAKIWNVSSGKELATLQDVPGDALLCAAFSLDNRLVATGGSDTDHLVYLSDAATGRKIRSLQGHTDYVFALAFSPDGTLLVSGGRDRTLRLWDVNTGAELARLQGDGENSWRAVFSPDGRYLASATKDGRVYLWDIAARRILQILEGPTQTVKAIAFSNDGDWLATGGDDNTVSLWEVATRKWKKLGLADHVVRVAFSPDGKRLITGGADGTLKLWDLNANQVLLTLNGSTDQVSSVTFSRDGTGLAASSLDGTIRLWRAASVQETSPAH